MAIPYAAYVARQVPSTVSADLDQMRPEKLLAADPEHLIADYVERLSVKPFPGDLDALRDGHVAQLLDPMKNEIRITMSAPGLRDFAQLFSFQPTKGVTVELHSSVENDDLWFNSDAQRLKQGFLQAVIDNVQQLNKDVVQQEALLRTHVSNIVHDRVGKARAAEEKRERERSELRAAGINLPASDSSSDPSGPPSTQREPASSQALAAHAELRVVKSKATRDRLAGLLNELERKLNSLEDGGALTPEAQDAVARALAIVADVRRLLSDTVTTPQRLRTLVANGIRITASGMRTVALAAAALEGLDGVGERIPEIIDAGGEVFEALSDELAEGVERL